MRIRHKLLVILTVAALTGSILVGTGAVWLVRSSVREHFVERIRAETSLLAEWTRTHERDDPQTLALQAAERLGLRVTLLSRDGVVLADSAKDRAGVLEMENHLGRPEVQEALQRGSGESFRKSATTNEDYYYAAWLIGGEGTARFVRIALPVTQIHRSQTRYSWSVMGIVLIAMLLLSALAYGAVRRLSKPVERMSGIADRMAAGAFDIDVPQQGTDEVSRLGAAVNRMKRALIDKIDELENERSLFGSVVSGMREGVLVVGPDRRIRLANEAVQKIFGLRFDPVGHLLAEVVRHPAVIGDVESVMSRGDEIRESVIRAEGSGRSFELHVTPLNGRAAGGDHAVLVLFFDITRLEALEGVRRDFVANVSHELRTPLTSIKAFVETLLDGGLEDRTNSVKFLKIAQKHTDRMGALIDDLTDLSLIETGAITLEMRDVDAAQVARDVIEQLHPRALEHDVQVHVDIPSPFHVNADRRRLEQMLTNLVDNAIKFNRPGGEARVLGSMDDGRPVLVIEDTGVGIPADSREKVFHRFYRVDPDRSRRAGGTGLGLAIVKHLVRLHGGTVRVESELGHGTRFILEFPPLEPTA